MRGTSVPRASFLMGVCNGGSRLIETLKSIKNQTEKNWECLVVNDGSTDSSRAILDSLAASDQRFRIFHHDQNKGLTRSLNEALSRARAPYIARHDADDLSHPDRLAKQIGFLEAASDVGLVGSAYELLDVDGAPLSVSYPPVQELLLRRCLLKRNVLAHGSLMMRKDALTQMNGYREEFQMAQDYDLILRLMEKWRLGVVPELLYRLRLVPQGGSLRKLEIQRFYAQTARKTFCLRASGRSDAGLLASRIAKRPVQIDSPSLVEQRYHLLRALHLVKAGRIAEATSDLKACSDPSLFLKALQLRLLCFLPGTVREFLIGRTRFVRGE